MPANLSAASSEKCLRLDNPILEPRSWSHLGWQGPLEATGPVPGWRPELRDFAQGLIQPLVAVFEHRTVRLFCLTPNQNFPCGNWCTLSFVLCCAPPRRLWPHHLITTCVLGRLHQHPVPPSFINCLPELELFDLSYLGYLGMEVFVPQVLQ